MQLNWNRIGKLILIVRLHFGIPIDQFIKIKSIRKPLHTCSLIDCEGKIPDPNLLNCRN